MAAFTFALVVAVLVNIITSLFSRRHGLQLLPWLMLYVGCYAAFNILRLGVVRAVIMDAAQRYPHWAMYTIAVVIASTLAVAYMRLIIAAVSVLDHATAHATASTSPHLQVPPAAPGNVRARPVEIRKLNQVKIIFKDSALLTAKKREFIEDEINSFYDYLQHIGYEIPKDCPPIGVSAGGGGMMGITPGSTLDFKIELAESKLTDRRHILEMYGEWMFGRVFDTAGKQGNRFSIESAWVYTIYYVDSFLGQHTFDTRSNIRAWTNGLWDIRTKYGKQFADKALFYTWQRWVNPEPNDSLDRYLYVRLSIGLDVLENTPGQYSEPIFAMLEKEGLPVSVRQPHRQ